MVIKGAVMFEFRKIGRKQPCRKDLDTGGDGWESMLRKRNRCRCSRWEQSGRFPGRGKAGGEQRGELGKR